MSEIFYDSAIRGNKKTTDEIINEFVISVASGIVTGVSSLYWEYAIKLADEAGSVAQTLMEYDKEFGEAIKKFFDGLSTAIGAAIDED